MARLMRYMINYQGRKLFSTLSIKLSKPVLYTLPPPILEKVMQDGVTWECCVRLLTSYPEGTIFYYTTDGSEPTESSAVFSDGLIINRNLTIRMIAVCEGEKTVQKSADVGILVIDDLKNAMPVFTLDGEIARLSEPELYREEGNDVSECFIGYKNSYPNDVDVVYTTDGSEPDEDSRKLPATISRNCTFKAMAIQGSNHSPVAVITIDDLKATMPIFGIDTEAEVKCSIPDFSIEIL